MARGNQREESQKKNLAKDSGGTKKEGEMNLKIESAEEG
jgi:hypothetical protein